MLANASVRQPDLHVPNLRLQLAELQAELVEYHYACEAMAKREGEQRMKLLRIVDKLNKFLREV